MDIPNLSQRILQELVRLRKAKDYTQKDMAQKQYMSPDQYRNTEKNRCGLPLDRFLQIGEILGEDPAKIIQNCLEMKPLGTQAPR